MAVIVNQKKAGREGKIAVKDIGALREVFKKEFYPQLVAHLHIGKLEKFFSFPRMNEVKETIEN